MPIEFEGDKDVEVRARSVEVMFVNGETERIDM